jgi:hypothetical protein
MTLRQTSVSFSIISHYTKRFPRLIVILQMFQNYWMFFSFLLGYSITKPHFVLSGQRTFSLHENLLLLGKAQIYLAFRSLIRTFDTSIEGTSTRKKKEYDFSFVLYSFIRTFDINIEGTSARKSSNIFGFSLVYSYLFGYAEKLLSF